MTERYKERCGDCKNWFSRNCPNKKIILFNRKRKFGSNMNPNNIACSNYLPEDVQDGVDTFAQEKTQSSKSVKVMVDETPVTLHIMRWVSVDDKNTPPLPNRVILVRAKALHTDEHYITTTGVYHPGSNLKWKTENGSQWYVEVTHWMPLPPPPAKQNTFASE